MLAAKFEGGEELKNKISTDVRKAREFEFAKFFFFIVFSIEVVVVGSSLIYWTKKKLNEK